MKVILLKDVPKVGRKYDVKDIADGYVRNFLLPRKLAELATEKKINALMATKQKNQEVQERTEELSQQAVKNMDGVVCTIKAKADEQGHVFKKLRVGDVLVAINKESPMPFTEDMITLESPITTIGSHEVFIGFGHTHSKVRIVVEREK